MMKYTNEQMEVLSHFEQNFSTAINADWSRAIGRTGAETLHNIWAQASGDNSPINVNCSTCVLRLLKDVGRLYFHQLEEYKATLHKVELSEQPAEPTKKRISTRKRKQV